MAEDAGTVYVRVVLQGVAGVQDGLKKVGTSATEAVKHLGSMDAAAERSSRTFGFLGHALSNFAGNMLTNAVQSLGGSLASWATGAIKGSMDIETLTASLTAMTGSAEAAQAKLKFLRAVAVPSTFTAEQLGQASLQLEAFGLNTQRILPIMAMLGQAFQADEEHLMMLTRMFGRFAAGQMPEVEALTRFGISKPMLAQYGIKFKGDELLSGPREALTSFEALIKDRYGRIFDEMQNTTSARWATVVDMFQQASAKAGDSILKMLAPAIERLGQWMNWIANSGWVTKVGDAFAKAFGFMGKGDFVDAFMARITVMIENLPAILKAVGNIMSGVWQGLVGLVQWMVRAFDMLMERIRDMRKYVESGALTTDIQIGIQSALPAWAGGSSDTLDLRVRRGQQLADWIKMHPRTGGAMDALGGFGVGFDAISQVMDNVGKSIDARVKEMGDYPKAAAGMPAQSGDFWSRMTDATKTSEATERNTRETAQNTRALVQGSLWGGAVRGRRAISSIEAHIELARALGLGLG